MWLQTMIQSSLILLRAAGLPECAFELVGAFGATGAGLVAGSGILPLGAAHKQWTPDPPAPSATHARDHGELVRFWCVTACRRRPPPRTCWSAYRVLVDLRSIVRLRKIGRKSARSAAALLNCSSAKRPINACLFPRGSILGYSGSGQGGNAETPRGTLSKALERIGRTDESLFLFLLTNASSVADRRKQGASAIARQPELRARQNLAIRKTLEFIGRGLAVLLGRSHVRQLY